jgi:predicted nuclease of predicted toxin-antitoxin system
MRLKLDENLGQQSAQLLRRRGHEVATVHDQGLQSAADADLLEECRRERRGLVTLDLDFANPLLFRPSQFEGIAVLRLPSRPSHTDLIAAVETLAGGLDRDAIRGKLWIIQRGRVREYQEETGD